MKQIILFGAIALSTLTFGQNIPSYVPANGLVGWWPFNGNANDESGNGNNGTVNGATLTTDRLGNVNEAYSFDGNADYIDCGNSNSVNINGDLTISVWIYAKNFNTDHGIVSKSGLYDLITSSPYSQPPLNKLRFVADNAPFLYSNPIQSNQWLHLVAVYSTMNGNSIYLNGTLISSDIQVGNITPNNTYNLYLGAHQPFAVNNWSWDGNLDDIGIWNRSLSQQEITDLYNASTCQTPTATITPQGNTSFCQGNSVVLEATSGSNYTYQWYKNGNAINGETNQTYTATTSGNYTVKVIDGACDVTSSATTVTVNSNPTVSFTLPSLIHNENGNYNLNGSPSGGSYSGNGITGNVLDPSIIGLGKQTIVYNYTDNNGCSGSKTATTVIYDTTGTVCTSYVSVSVTDTLIIDVSLAGLSAPNNINTMKVYPNPSNDVVNIDNGDYALMNGYSIKIINGLGQEKFNNAITIPAFQIPVSQLGATGVYYINIYDNQSQLVESKVLVLE